MFTPRRLMLGSGDTYESYLVNTLNVASLWKMQDATKTHGAACVDSQGVHNLAYNIRDTGVIEAGSALVSGSTASTKFRDTVQTHAQGGAQSAAYPMAAQGMNDGFSVLFSHKTIAEDTVGATGQLVTIGNTSSKYYIRINIADVSGNDLYMRVDGIVGLDGLVTRTNNTITTYGSVTPTKIQVVVVWSGALANSSDFAVYVNGSLQTMTTLTPLGAGPYGNMTEALGSVLIADGLGGNGMFGEYDYVALSPDKWTASQVAKLYTLI